MSFVASAVVVTAVAGVASASMQADAARSAARSQRNAARDANALQWDMYQQQRADQEPWRMAGQNALQEIQDNKFMDNWQQDPGYAFRLQEGQKALEAAAAARGRSNSGATLKALTRYGQDFASGEYNNVYNRTYNRLANLAGIGQAATNSTANAGTNYANNAANNILQSGNAQAAGTIGQANAWSGALQNGANSWMNYQMMNSIFNNGGSGRVNYNVGTPSYGYGGGSGYLGVNTNFGGY